MKALKEAGQMLRYNLKTLVGFEFLFKLLSVFFFTPFFVHLFEFIMKARGYSYLTLENATAFFAHPLTILLLFFLLLLMMVYTMFDITTIIVILDYSYQKEKIKIMDAIRISLEKCKSMFRLQNITLAILILFLIPFLNVGISSSFISSIRLPEYIMEYILKNSTLLISVLLLTFFFLFLILKWLYAIHYYVLENVSFKEARKKSSHLSYKKHLKDWGTLLLVQFFFFLIYVLFIGIGILGIFLFSNWLENIFVKSFLTTVISGFIAISFLIFTLLSTPISYATITSLFYIRKNRKKEEILHLPIYLLKENQRTNKTLKKLFVSIVMVTFTIGVFFTYGLYKGEYDLNIEYIRKIDITAHRGSSINYPENTMSAFIGAKNLGADFIELDVQQTKDGSIVVMHDKNLKRVAKMDKNVWELTLDELKEVDVGSSFKEEFKGERIPTLKEVVLWAKENDVLLNIELKPTGKEMEFEKSVIEILKSADYLENSYIASQVYSVLETTKKIEENIKTIYVASVFYGDFHAFPCADHFSLEASNITSSLVKSLHKEGKKIYAWTINSEDVMQKMIELKVDNIITDNIELAKNTIVDSRKSNLIYEYIKWVEKLF